MNQTQPPTRSAAQAQVLAPPTPATRPGQSPPPRKSLNALRNNQTQRAPPAPPTPVWCGLQWAGVSPPATHSRHIAGPNRLRVTGWREMASSTPRRALHIREHPWIRPAWPLAGGVSLPAGGNNQKSRPTPRKRRPRSGQRHGRAGPAWPTASSAGCCRNSTFMGGPTCSCRPSRPSAARPRVFINAHAHHWAIDQVHDDKAPGDDVDLIPVGYLDDRLQFIGRAGAADQLRRAGFGHADKTGHAAPRSPSHATSYNIPVKLLFPSRCQPGSPSARTGPRRTGWCCGTGRRCWRPWSSRNSALNSKSAVVPPRQMTKVLASASSLGGFTGEHAVFDAPETGLAFPIGHSLPVENRLEAVCRRAWRHAGPRPPF